MKKFLLLLLLLLSSCATGLSLTSCSHTRYIPMPEVHQRDSLSKSVNVLVNTTYVDRTHTESFLHGTTTAQKTTDWGLSLIGSFRVDTLLVKDSIYVEKFTDVEVRDTVVVTRRDTIRIPVPVEPPPDHSPHRRFLALSERARILRTGCLIGGIGAFLLLVFYTMLRLYLRR